MYKREWIEEDKQRLLDMDRWYVLDGRHRKTHKMHGLYTGLKELGPKLDKLEELVDRMSNAYDLISKAKKSR